MHPHTSPDHAEAISHTSEGVGRLDFRDWSRFLWAWRTGASIASWLYSAGKISANVDPDVRVQSSSEPSINLPATWLAADEIARLLQNLNSFAEPEQVAHDQKGSYWAVELGRAVSTADQRWPRVERAHRMMAMRCGGCDEMTLIYRPPRFHGDRIVVSCPKCGFSMPEDVFSVNALLIEAELRGASTASSKKATDATA